MVVLAAHDDVTTSCDRRRLQDLARLDREHYGETMRELRANTELAMDVFGYDLVNDWDMDDCDSIWAHIAGRNTEIGAGDAAGTGLTWLHYAACRGWLKLVQRLIESPDCDVNCVSDDGHWTPIFMVC